ncbi:MAG: major facilitator superfamily 1 [Firmicutes bacterium]|nr:major facilitator superfamily 1 [Bacillota bacterium]
MNLGLNFLIAYLIFIFQGLTAPLGSVMIMEIAKKYSVDTSSIGYIFSLGIMGGGIAAVASGFLLETLGKRKLIFMGIIIALSAGAAITVSNYLLIFAVGMFLSGVSSWFLVAVGNYIIVKYFQGEKRSSQLNLLNFFFSIGALIAPIMAGFMLERNIPWEFVFLAPFVLLGILFILAYSPAFGTAELPSSLPPKTFQPAVAPKWNVNIYLTGAALGFYCMLELSYTSWIVVHLRENLVVDIVSASLVLTVFYICQAAGRFVSGFIVKHVALKTYIISCAAIGLITLFLIMFSKSYMTVLCLTILMGLGIAGLYPSILSYGTLQVKTTSPHIMTFFLTSGIVGSIAVMLLTSFLKQRFGVLACISTGAIAATLVILFIGTTTVRLGKPK